MGDPLNEQTETITALRQVFEAAGPYLEGLPERLVYDRAAEPLLGELGGPLPEEGSGTGAAVDQLIRIETATATASAGPRFFHFVIGGSTPAALAADWVVSLLDQNAFVRASSRLADAVETVALDWLRQLAGLPPGWGGALTASATSANLTGLALATHWWAERHGVDATSSGLAGLPRMPVLSGGYVHHSARKALQMLGHGKDTVEVLARDEIGRIDLAAVRRRLGELDGAPAVLLATAGEPNAADFDPLADVADLAEEFGAWLHVDAAFGLFAALSPRTRLWPPSTRCRTWSAWQRCRSTFLFPLSFPNAWPSRSSITSTAVLPNPARRRPGILRWHRLWRPGGPASGDQQLAHHRCRP